MLRMLKYTIGVKIQLKPTTDTTVNGSVNPCPMMMRHKQDYDSHEPRADSTTPIGRPGREEDRPRTIQYRMSRPRAISLANFANHRRRTARPGDRTPPLGGARSAAPPPRKTPLGFRSSRWRLDTRHFPLNGLVRALPACFSVAPLRRASVGHAVLERNRLPLVHHLVRLDLHEHLRRRLVSLPYCRWCSYAQLIIPAHLRAAPADCDDVVLGKGTVSKQGERGFCLEERRSCSCVTLVMPAGERRTLRIRWPDGCPDAPDVRLSE